jgi:hypothetical protein
VGTNEAQRKRERHATGGLAVALFKPVSHPFDVLIICCLHLMSWTTIEKEALLFIGSNGSGRILTDVDRNQFEVRFLREICGMSGQERVKPRRFSVAPICGGN